MLSPHGQTLAVNPARLPEKIHLSDESNLLLNSINEVAKRIIRLEQTIGNDNREWWNASAKLINDNHRKKLIINDKIFEIGHTLFLSDTELGEIVEISGREIVSKKSGKFMSTYITEDNIDDLSTVPY